MGAQPASHLQHMHELQFTSSAAGLEHGQQQMWSQGDRSASAVPDVQTGAGLHSISLTTRRRVCIYQHRSGRAEAGRSLVLTSQPV